MHVLVVLFNWFTNSWVILFDFLRSYKHYHPSSGLHFFQPFCLVIVLSSSSFAIFFPGKPQWLKHLFSQFCSNWKVFTLVITANPFKISTKFNIFPILTMKSLLPFALYSRSPLANILITFPIIFDFRGIMVKILPLSG